MIRLCGLFASLGLKNLRHLRDVGVIIGVRITSDMAFLDNLILLPKSIMVISADGGGFSVTKYFLAFVQVWPLCSLGLQNSWLLRQPLLHTRATGD